MQIKQLPIGNSSLYTSPLGFGTWPLSYEDQISKKEAIKVLHAAMEAGYTFIDTADAYCKDNSDMGYCEQIVAEALKSYSQSNKHNIIVATKGGCLRPKGAWTTEGSAQHLKKACEASLKALNVECIDLYQLHAPDPKVSFQESIQALADLKTAGKIREIGLSNVNVPEIEMASQITSIISIQNRCNPFDLNSFNSGVLSYCEENNLSFFAYSPLGGQEEKYLMTKNKPLNTTAQKYELTPFQIALAWLKALSPKIIPIPGSTKIDHVKTNAAIMSFQLEQSDIDYLDKALGVY